MRWEHAISRTCGLARYLESRIKETPELELLAPVELNIVCFRYRAGDDAHRVNARIVADLHEAGDVAPSTTVIDGRLAIRAAIVNHRTSRAEIDTLIEKVVAAGRAIEHSALRSRQAQPADAEDWMPRRLRESRLRELEAQIASDAAAIPLRFERACLLAEVGRTAEARDAYLDLLSREPSHRAALNNLGTLLYETGYRTAARTAYAEAVARHPGDPMSHVNLANALRESGDLAEAREHYETALRLQPGSCRGAPGPGWYPRGIRRSVRRRPASASGVREPARGGFALSRRAAAGLAAAAGRVRGRQHSHAPFSGRSGLSDRSLFSWSFTIPRLRCRRTGSSSMRSATPISRLRRSPRPSPCWP